MGSITTERLKRKIVIFHNRSRSIKSYHGNNSRNPYEYLRKHQIGKLMILNLKKDLLIKLGKQGPKSKNHIYSSRLEIVYRNEYSIHLSYVL